MALEPLSRYPEDLAPSWTRQRWYTSLVAAVNELLTGTQSGMGSPEGVVFAPQGVIFRRKDGGAATTVYAKTTAETLNTGWVALS